MTLKSKNRILNYAILLLLLAAIWLIDTPVFTDTPQIGMLIFGVLIFLLFIVDNMKDKLKNKQIKNH